MAESLAARSGRSSEMRPDVSSGGQRPSRMGLTIGERLSGSSTAAFDSLELAGLSAEEFRI